MAIIAYSFSDCMAACAGLNRFQNNDTCVGLTFDVEMASTVKRQGANCFLKNAINLPPVATNRCVGARLCADANCTAFVG
jgi:hypothetical protein